jgi:hypothetical protein|tara:strand:+ start:181 stop:600 length:420 start_codon:yes stop_codon:yes gene_type:complete
MSIYTDPLETALLRYFNLRSPAIAALAAFSDLAGDTANLRRRVFRLQSVLQGSDLPDARSEADLMECLNVAESRIAEGTQRHFMLDEHCLSGDGYMMTHMTPEAEQLSETIDPLQRLCAAWRDVQAAQATERALAQLRS